MYIQGLREVLHQGPCPAGVLCVCDGTGFKAGWRGPVDTAATSWHVVATGPCAAGIPPSQSVLMRVMRNQEVARALAGAGEYTPIRANAPAGARG